MGRKAKDNKLKMLSGSKHVKKGQEIPEDAPQMWPAPDVLGPDGREMWVDVGSILLINGVMLEIDKMAFTLLCQTWDMVCEFRRILSLEGAIIGDKRNSQKKHPALTGLNQQMAMFKSLCGEFAITPTSRGRAGFVIPEVNPEDSVWDAFQKKREDRRQAKAMEEFLD
jgi:P27 family predicted phage terminase small subunit